MKHEHKAAFSNKRIDISDMIDYYLSCNSLCKLHTENGQLLRRYWLKPHMACIMKIGTGRDMGRQHYRTRWCWPVATGGSPHLPCHCTPAAGSHRPCRASNCWPRRSRLDQCRWWRHRRAHTVVQMVAEWGDTRFAGRLHTWRHNQCLQSQWWVSCVVYAPCRHLTLLFSPLYPGIIVSFYYIKSCSGVVLYSG